MDNKAEEGDGLTSRFHETTADCFTTRLQVGVQNYFIVSMQGKPV